MAAAAAAAAAGAALEPFVQLKGSGGELIGDAPPMQMTPPLSSRRRRRRGPKQFAAAAVVASAASSRPISVDNWRNKKRLDGDNNKNNNNNKVTPEKLDQWIRDSVEEIVSNIGEAPFLVHVFCNGPMVRLEREEAVPERWPSIKKRWDRGARTPPDGIILVEELKDEAAAAAAAEEEAEATKTWGLLVQGKGMDSASCYILNTCRVRSTVGFCTHFCLLRAKCFGDPFEMQLRNAWLQ